MIPSGPRMKASRKPGLRASGPIAISAPLARCPHHRRSGRYASDRSSPTFYAGFADPIRASSRVVKQGGPLGGRVALRKQFESIEQDVVGKRDLIDREVTFEHAPVRAHLPVPG